MGNDSSRLKGLIIDKNAVEANDFWCLYNAEMPTWNDEGKQKLSIFQGEPVVAGQLWVVQGPMERAIKNLMIYRHPYILKYVATWEQGGQKHLATERVRPLMAEGDTLNGIQAQARHLNICMSSVNVALDGSWRLAGFEYVWKSKEITKKLLDLASAYRYKPAVDPHEVQGKNRDFIEQYAFATLCEEILAKVKARPDDTVTPYAEDFCTYCSTHLKHKNAEMRPSLSAVLLHPYFNHEFVLIHSFLIELPLKSVAQKQEFFTGLIDRLRCFNEQIVGAQLSELLLSRMVLLDPTAQLCVTPYVLKTKSNNSSALFSNSTYTQYLMPHIKKHFRLRDAQMRLILLEYFMNFVRLLPKDELLAFILPFLQVGLRDTNDILVAKTMHCLADLVPILGSTAVVGGERVRLFSDGRPQAAVTNATSHWVEPRSITPVMSVSNSMDYMVSGSPLPPDREELGGSLHSLLASSIITSSADQNNEMPPRLSPDGGEDDKLSSVITDEIVHTAEHNELQPTPTVSNEGDAGNARDELQKDGNIKFSEQSAISDCKGEEEEEEQWSDWETDDLQRLSFSNENICSTSPVQLDAPLLNEQFVNSSNLREPTETSPTSATSVKTNTGLKINDDLTSLDIVVQKTAVTNGNSQAFDFFKDMEPVIETQRHNINNIHADTASSSSLKTPSNGILQPRLEEEIKIDSSRFAAVVSDDSTICLTEANDWGVDDEDVDWSTAA